MEHRPIRSDAMHKNGGTRPFTNAASPPLSSKKSALQITKNMKKDHLLTLLVCFLQTFVLSSTERTRDWTYIELDHARQKWGDFEDPEWLRYMGIDVADVDADGDLDLLAGRYLYFNPGGDMSDVWRREDLGDNVDGMLLTDVDGDSCIDIIAQALPDVYWIKPVENGSSTEWRQKVIGQLPPTGHVNGQGYRMADLVNGGKPEIVLQALGGIYVAEIPQNPAVDEWSFSKIVETGSDEGFGVGDVDRDGDLDIVFGDLSETDEIEHPTELKVAINPGNVQVLWTEISIGRTSHAIDRVELADLNADGTLDAVVTEERYPGPDPDATLYWFEAPGEPLTQQWRRHALVTQYSMNNLGIADMDADGDVDIVTSEHKGSDLKMQIFLNDGKGDFTETCIDMGREGHLGCKLADMDKDGDLDIVSAAWDHYEYLHLWRNDSGTD